MEKDLIVAGERIGGFYLGSSRKEILEQIKDQYTLIKLPYHQIIEFNCYKIWIHESDDIVTQILVHGGFEGKFLKEIGIGSSLSLLDEMGLKYEKGDYVYYIPSIPGISFELSDEEDWNELTSPIESISIFLPKYVSVG